MNSDHCLGEAMNFWRQTLVLLFAGFFLLRVVAGEDPKWHASAMELVDKAHKSLISAGFCSSKSDCVKKEYVLFSLRSDGIFLNVYGVKDRATIATIAAECGLILSRDGIPFIELHAYAKTKRESLRQSSFLGREYYQFIELRGKYVNN
jgi:hypothetical protein